MRIVDYALRGIVAAILLQTLWFKFTAHPESVAIFSQLHAEPWGRVLSGIIELCAAALIIVRATVVYGALLSAGTMCAALLAHIFVIGISVRNDGGLLFLLACAVASASIALLILHRAAAAKTVHSLLMFRRQ